MSEAKLIIDGKEINLDVIKGTQNEKAICIERLRS